LVSEATLKRKQTKECALPPLEIASVFESLLWLLLMILKITTEEKVFGVILKCVDCMRKRWREVAILTQKIVCCLCGWKNKKKPPKADSE